MTSFGKDLGCQSERHGSYSTLLVSPLYEFEDKQLSSDDTLQRLSYQSSNLISQSAACMTTLLIQMQSMTLFASSYSPIGAYVPG